MTNSLIVGGIKLGMQVAVACPKGYEPDAALMKWAAENGEFSCSEDVLGEASDADVLMCCTRMCGRPWDRNRKPKNAKRCLSSIKSTIKS